MKIFRNTPIVIFLIYVLFVQGSSIKNWLLRGFAEIENAVEHGITVRIEASWNPTTTKIESESQNDEQ